MFKEFITLKTMQVLMAFIILAIKNYWRPLGFLMFGAVLIAISRCDYFE